MVVLRILLRGKDDDWFDLEESSYGIPDVGDKLMKTDINNKKQ